MPLSEIDHIFASKPKRRLSAPSTSTDAPDKQSKGAKRKRGRTAETGVVAHGLQSAKRRAPETVLDPSVRIAAASKKNKAAAGTAIKKSRKPDTEDEDRFKDSRGAGPRRKTEEGFAVYKEDELGITDQGGDTPLCPFDCQCCF
ncbi:hypothetical protein AcV7_000536 [Taiwanofungus camphoratus]|nr:hypothetical protein AcV7_000536 [Antrodia cinnamomea]